MGFFNVILPCYEQDYWVTFKKQECRVEDALISCKAVRSLWCITYNNLGSLEEVSRHNLFAVGFSNNIPQY